MDSLGLSRVAWVDDLATQQGVATILVRVGQRVTWVNGDPGPHTATANGRRWNPSQMVPGCGFTATMTAPGTYTYYCQDHPRMQAKVIVTN